MNECISAKAVERAEASDNAYGVSDLGRMTTSNRSLNTDDPNNEIQKPGGQNKVRG